MYLQRLREEPGQRLVVPETVQEVHGDRQPGNAALIHLASLSMYQSCKIARNLFLFQRSLRFVFFNFFFNNDFYLTMN